RLDHCQHGPAGGRHPLARGVPGPLAQLVDHLGREMTLQLPRYRRSLLVDLWTRRLTSCSSLLHRAPFVGRFATKPTKEWPDLFPSSRYVTRKGSGDGWQPWGGTRDADHAVYGCLYNGNGTCTGVTNIAPVGSKPLGDGRFGHADLVGSIREFVLSIPYQVPCIDCGGADSTNTTSIERGGSYGPLLSQGEASMATTSGRRASQRTPGHQEIGARCARTP